MIFTEFLHRDLSGKSQLSPKVKLRHMPVNFVMSEAVDALNQAFYLGKSMNTDP